MNILLIENDKLFAATVLAALKHAGYQPNWAFSAAEAIKLADNYKPELIILELNIAANNGVEFLYEFRSYPEWQEIPVIIYSWVPKAALKISNTVWRNLNVAAYHYKPETSLKKLLSNLPQPQAVYQK